MTAKPTRGLTAAPNAAARMQELLRQQAAAPPQEEQTAEEAPDYLNTQVSNYVSDSLGERVIDPLINHSRDEVSTQARKRVSRSKGKPEAEPAPAPEVASAENLHTRITSRLGAKDGKEATVRLSIDVSERLHERIKVYCASNRIPTTRALVVALLENLLDEAGY